MKNYRRVMQNINCVPCIDYTTGTLNVTLTLSLNTT